MVVPRRTDHDGTERRPVDRGIVPRDDRGFGQLGDEQGKVGVELASRRTCDEAEHSAEGTLADMAELSTVRLVAAEFAGTTIVMLGGPGLIVLGGESIGTLEAALGFGLAIAIAIGVIGAVANPILSLALTWPGRSRRGKRSATGSGSSSAGSSAPRSSSASTTPTASHRRRTAGTTVGLPSWAACSRPSSCCRS